METNVTMRSNKRSRGATAGWRRCAALVLAMAVVGCTDSPLEPSVERGGRIVLDRNVVSADSHQQVITFSARVVDERGVAVDDVPLEWIAEDPDVLESLSDGSFRTLSDGASDVVARVPRSHPSVSPEGYFANAPTARAHVRVDQVARSLVLLEGEVPTDEDDVPNLPIEVVEIWAADDTVRLTARPADAENQVVDDHATSGLQWSSVDEDVTMVDGDGTIRPVGDGDATIQVSGDGLTGEVLVRVRTTQEVSACATLEGQAEAEASACSSVQLTFVRGSAES